MNKECVNTATINNSCLTNLYYDLSICLPRKIISLSRFFRIETQGENKAHKHLFTNFQNFIPKQYSQRKIYKFVVMPFVNSKNTLPRELSCYSTLRYKKYSYLQNSTSWNQIQFTLVSESKLLNFRKSTYMLDLNSHV